MEEPTPDEPGLPELPAREDAPPDEGGAEVPTTPEDPAAADDPPPEEVTAALLEPLDAVTAEELLTPEDAATLVAVEVPPLEAEEDMARLDDTCCDAEEPPPL